MGSASEGTLGDRIGIGRTAEVYAWGDRAIVKILRPECSDSVGEREAAVARMVTNLGLAAPRFLGVERVDGRFGLLYERVHGQTMLDQVSRRAGLVDPMAELFAELHAQMHIADGSGLPPIRDVMRRAIERVAADLGETRTEVVLARLDRLPDGGTICHGDMHPGNVLLAPSGPVVIDWLTATSGPPEADLARTEFLLVGAAVPEEVPRLERIVITGLRRQFASSWAAAYRRIRSVDDHLLERWRLPVIAARLAEEIDSERDALLEQIDGEIARGA